jgi:hypothetical protein
MTTLPTTWGEAVKVEALRFTNDLIAEQRQPGGLFHHDAEAIHGQAQ